MTPVNPRHGAASFNTPMALLNTHFPPLTYYLEQRDIQSAFTEKQHTAYGGARPLVSGCSGCLSCMWPRAVPTSRRVCTALHAALLTASVQIPASAVIALVLSSLAESPSLYRMATKECPPPLSASSVASLPHFMEMHVCDLW